MATKPRPADTLAKINLVNERTDHANNHYQTYFRKLARYYDIYRGLYTGSTPAQRNNISIPFVLSVAQSSVSRKVQSIFTSWPIVNMVGNAPEDAAIARKNETLVSAQMKDCGSFAKAVDFFLTAEIYGTAICRHGWRKDVRRERWRANSEFGEQVMEGDVTRFDGPDWQVVDPVDFLPQPGARRVKEAMWVVHRYVLDLDEIKARARQGIYRQSAVDQLSQSPMPSEVDDTNRQRLNIYRNFQEWEARRSEKHANPIEIREMWGMVPDEFAIDGVKFVVFTVANRRVLLRDEASPYWHGELPFIDFTPMPDMHYFHGLGKCEIAEKMQMTANRFANQKLDAMDLWIDPPILIDRNSGIDTQNLYLRPGRIIGIDGAVDDSRIRPLSPDLRGIQQAMTEIQQLWGWIQQGTGIVEDTVQGGPSAGRQTAREYVGRQEQVMTRLTLESRLAEEQFVEPLADAFMALNRQYLETPHEVNILGSAATVNPITGLPMPQERVTIGLEDLNRDYRARAVASGQTVGKAARQQNLVTVLQAMTTNPAFLGMVNWAAFAREIFEAFDMKNPDELLVSQQTMANQQALQAAGPAGGAGGAPPMNGNVPLQPQGPGLPGAPAGTPNFGFGGLPGLPALYPGGIANAVGAGR